MSLDELRASIAGEGTLLRIELRLAGADPRIRPPRTPAGARRARDDRREAGQDRRRGPDALDDTLAGHHADHDRRALELVDPLCRVNSAI
jgi:hypothetical protein